MTRAELSELNTAVLTALGFEMEQDTILWSLMRQTTPRRARKAIEKVARDETCITMLDRHNRLLGLLQKRAALVRR